MGDYRNFIGSYRYQHRQYSDHAKKEPPPMSDSNDLRTRIAAVQAQHHHWDYAGALTCACGEDFGLARDAGWEAAVAEWAQHVADAVIRELGLTQEQLELMDGMCGQSINYTTGKVTNHYRAATKQHRYVTEWTSDE